MNNLPRVFPPSREWVDTVAEIVETLTGKRRNKIVMPTLPALSFSNPPTQAECEAIEAKLNEVIKVVSAVVERSDG